MTENDAAMRNAARFILRALLQGKDPESGRALHRDEVVHRPEVMRALHLGLEALTDPRERSSRQRTAARQERATRSKVPERAGQGWDRKEDEELRFLFGQRRTVRDIATELGRTRGAITSRLVLLELVKKRDES